ncbi:hypothetical protein G3M55_32695, partial [Streptomyces sp. SID8455]|nr:hypothetical protein [Streptomyces sp. SID8455]
MRQLLLRRGLFPLGGGRPALPGHLTRSLTGRLVWGAWRRVLPRLPVRHRARRPRMLLPPRAGLRRGVAVTVLWLRLRRLRRLLRLALRRVRGGALRRYARAVRRGL